jgi:16S rRNA (cytidine1402-2'-O)-methyltransferase
MGVLYVVATPIGNLQDMTPRAIETLKSVDLIAAEDTRHSGRLLKAFEIDTPMISYHKHNRAGREQLLLDRLSEQDVALISDAGTPAIADPGVELVAAAIAAGYRVVPIPGASSVVAAVSASGLIDGPFVFLGFLPRTVTERRHMLGKAAISEMPVVLFESPLRLAATLIELADVLGDRRAFIARELTKMHEELVYGTLRELGGRYAGSPPKGEVVIAVGGAESTGETTDSAESIVRGLLADGLKPSRAAREVAAILNIPGAEAYDLVRRIAAGKVD